MRVANGLLAVLVLVLVPLVSGQSGCESSTDDETRVYGAVDQVRRDLEAERGVEVPNLNVLVQTPRQTVFVSAAEDQSRAVSKDTFFRFASNTKTFTASAVLSMYERGWLDIADSITDIMPGGVDPYVPASAEWNVPYKSQITIRQLLQHSAGVYDVDNDPVPGYGGMSYVAWTLEQDPNHQFNATEMVEQVALNNLSYFAPGTGYHYSNTGYTMLGEIVSRVYSHRAGSPKTYQDYMNDYVVGGLSPVPVEAGFPRLATNSTLPAPFVCGREYLSSGVVVHCNDNMSANVAAGNGYSTMSELNRFVRNLMRGQSVLSSATVRLMQADSTVYAPNDGLGCFYVQNLGYGHNGAIIGNISHMAYNPQTGVSVVAYLPMWDLRDGLASFVTCYNAVIDAAYAALEVLGYPGKP